MVAKRKGFSLVEMLVVISITSLLFTIALISYNNLSNPLKREYVTKAEEEVAASVAHVLMSGKTIANGYYTPERFFSEYKVTIPPNPLIPVDSKTGISTADNWYIYLDAVTNSYVIEALDPSHVAHYPLFVKSLYPFLSFPSSHSSETFIQGTEENTELGNNLLLNGDFEYRIKGWTYDGEDSEINLSGSTPMNTSSIQSLLLKYTNNTQRTLKQFIRVDGTKNDRYCFSGYFKNLTVSDNVVSITFTALSGSEVVSSFSITPNTATSEWQMLKAISDGASSTYDTIVFCININNTTGAPFSCLLDDFRLYLLTGGE